MTTKKTIQNSIYVNTIIIRVKEDFPTPIAGFITLKNNTRYIINGKVDLGTDGLILQDGSNIRGSDISSELHYSGTDYMFTSTDYSIMIDTLFLIQLSTGKYFNFQNSTRTKNIMIKDVLLYSGELGIVDGYDSFALNQIDFIGTLGELNLMGSNNIIFNKLYFDNTNNGDYIKIDTGTFNAISIANCRFIIEPGKHAISLLNNPNITMGIISSNIFSPTNEIALLNLDPSLLPEWYITGNTGINGKNSSIMPVYNEDKIDTIIDPQSGSHLFNSSNNSIYIFDGLVFHEIITTPVYNVFFKEDFLSGDFSTNNWVTVNDTDNKWVIGTAVAKSNTYSAYISNDSGTSAAYNNSKSNVSHFYNDFTIDQDYDIVNLNFDYQCEAELGYDYGNVYILPTSITPVAGTEINSQYLIGDAEYNNQSVWKSIGIPLGAKTNGETFRLVFSYKNDGSVGNNPAFCVDNIKINTI